MTMTMNSYSESVSPPPPSPRRELIPILHGSHQIVLYNPTSHALSIREQEEVAAKARALFCPYCDRPFDVDVDSEKRTTDGQSSRAHNYFQLLEISNESSRPSTPFAHGSPRGSSSSPTLRPSNLNRGINTDNMAEGYFSAFFREEYRLGMGANGSVYLCQVSS